MKRLDFLIAVLMLFVAVAAADASDNKAVRYTVLHNYFHNNDAPIPSSPLITTQKEFDTQFGMATVMGKDGQPTKVNFNKQAVLAIVLPVTDNATDIDSVSVTETGEKELTLAYTIHVGVRRSFSIQPIELLAISGKYKDYTVKVRPVVRKDVNAYVACYETVTLNDARHNINLIVDFPQKADTPLSTGIRRWIGWNIDKIANTLALDSLHLPAPVNISANEDGMDAVQSFADIIGCQMDDLNKENSTNGNPNRCSLTATISKIWESDRLVSFEATGYTYGGGAHGLGFCYGATFDKNTGKPVDLVNPSPELQKFITNALHKSMDGVTFWQEVVPMPQTAPYAVAGGKIKFVYQPYEAGAFAIGMPECEVYPYEIEGNLTEAGKTIQ